MKDHGVKVTVTDQMLAELAGFWNEGAGPSISKILQEEILSATLTGETPSAPAA